MLNITNNQGKQIKITVPYDFTPIRMAIVKKRSDSVVEDVEKKESLCTVSGMQTGTATMENSVEVPQKIRNTAIV